MKKRLLAIILSGMVALQCTGCGTTYQEVTEKTKTVEESICGGYFIVIDNWGDMGSCYIVYAKDTKVKYFVKWTGYQFGITPLYNEDGTLQIYEK